ncbi:phenylacetate-CoA oxygenase subunit PaaC [Actinospica sp. MGRD01-02]|uniref:Phenylacetate-CoA oxygenase subunit PaaC n=1 Tax=Actinospica acidithermotolerans TaxID=2828514 RepID=A0A941EEL9_9ACTN|nr:phenylacetate-CoA oxygenase subunit PaaC [Actinospica acidithermotolerans]
MTVLARTLKPLDAYVLRLGDDALIASHRLTEWLTRAPDLEEEAALANVALDQLGQARFLLGYAGRSSGLTEDELVYRRGEREYRNCLLVEVPNGDFAHTILRLLLFSAYQRGLYEALSESADDELAAFAKKACVEVDYHYEYAAGWTLRLGDGGEEGHDRAGAALAELWPYTAELFAGDELVTALAAEGLVPEPEAIHGPWTERVVSILAEATLGTSPSVAWRPGGGRSGLHTEALGRLLAEMQSVHRAHPGVTW